MLISLRHRFVFVAGQKVASTAIEAALARHAEIALSRSEWGKHDTLAEIQARFGWAFHLIPRHEWLIWGVMRDPLEVVVSLYTSHRDQKFQSRPELYTGDMDWRRFMTEWMPRHRDPLAPQHLRFRDLRGAWGLDYLVDYARLEEQAQEVARHVGLPDGIAIPRANVSPPGFSAADVPPEDAAAIREKYAKDAAILSELSGRLLRPRGAEVTIF